MSALRQFRTKFPALFLLETLGISPIPQIGQTPPRAKMSTMSTRNGKMPCGSCDAPTTLSWNTVVTPLGEPGQQLTISGTIFKPDGTTPAKGITLFIFQTDATGHYNRQDDPNDPRLRGWMQTGEDGRYEFRTIKPAPYPEMTTPAHIHVHLYGSGYPEYFVDEYWFEGDPLITQTERGKLTGRGGFSSVTKLVQDEAGVLRGVRNFKLEYVSK